jgi:hypothetical protein
MTLILAIFNLSALGSCLLSVKNGGAKYCVSIWKHTEDANDTVESSDYLASSLKEVAFYMESKKCATFIFNQGVFTSMRYDQEVTKRWANLTTGEKDMVFFLQSRFNLNEKQSNERELKDSKH